MKKDTYQLLEQINQKELFLVYGDEPFPARLSGYKLEYPKLQVTEGPAIVVELNWCQVERLSQSKDQKIYIYY